MQSGRSRPSGSSALALRLRLIPQPLSRTPRPKSWMICAPSPRPTFISPMVPTRQLFHPSVNFREPMSTWTVERGAARSWKSEPANSRSATWNPSRSQSFTRFVSSPTLTTPKGALSPTRNATSPAAPFRFSTCSAPPRRALKSRSRVSPNTCSAESPLAARWVKRPANRFSPAAETSPWARISRMRATLPARSDT